MSNKEISASFQLLAKLMELHGENPFKIRSYQRAHAYLSKLGTPLGDMSEAEIGALPGIGKAITGKIGELLTVGKMKTLERYKDMTPLGIQELVLIKGLGPKKIKTVWEELGVESATELLYACTENRLIELKGFGEKTQHEIKKQLEFFLQNRSKFIHAKIKPLADALLVELRAAFPKLRIELTGGIRRCQPIVCKLEYLANSLQLDWALLDSFDLLTEQDDLVEGTYQNHIPVTIYKCQPHDFAYHWLRTTGPKELSAKVHEHEFSSEEEIFEQLKMSYVAPEARSLLTTDAIPPDNLISRHHLQGVIHNHSVYSDGIDTIADLAAYATSAGYQYLGITDHSKIAVYANGLDEEALEKQWAEIDQLNDGQDSFQILKGIECDILSDGALDYDDAILEQFDFVIASIHTNIKMDEEKATKRTLKAIEHPATNILGHPTGRLLLGRNGYPLDMQRVIDACAANQVAIELNASPYRLDLDWHWIPLAREKGVLISINPDAHAKEAIDYIDFGVKIARKGWLGVEGCLNARDVTEFLKFCEK